MPPAGGRGKGDILFRKREYPLWNPKRKAFSIASEQLEELQCLPIALPCARRCRVSIAIRFDLLLLSAAALPILCRCSLIPVYQGTHQCGERSNAAFGTQSAAVLPSLAPHDSKARLIPVTNRRRFMAKPCPPHPIPQAVQLFEIGAANVRGQGAEPLAFSWGI